MLARTLALLSSALSVLPLMAQQPGSDPAPAPRPADPAAAGSAVPPGAAGLGALELARAMTETMQLATPGAPHRRLQSLAGTYDVEMVLRPPGIEPQTCPGRARAASVLGGRYVVVNLTVRVQGVQLEGLYIFGYDNLHDLYTASWRDSLSTWSVECSGSQDPVDGDRVAMRGTMVDAASPTGREFELELRFGDSRGADPDPDRGTVRPPAFEIAVHDTVGTARVEVMRQRFRRADEVEPGRDAAREPAPEPGKGDGGK